MESQREALWAEAKNQHIRARLRPSARLYALVPTTGYWVYFMSWQDSTVHTGVSSNDGRSVSLASQLGEVAAV